MTSSTPFFHCTTGCQWRLLPKGFPLHVTVQRYLHAWRDSDVWQAINHALLMDVRQAARREASPTASMIDGRSVTTTKAGSPYGSAAAVTWLYAASVKLMSRRLMQGHRTTRIRLTGNWKPANIHIYKPVNKYPTRLEWLFRASPFRIRNAFSDRRPKGFQRRSRS